MQLSTIRCTLTLQPAERGQRSAERGQRPDGNSAKRQNGRTFKAKSIAGAIYLKYASFPDLGKSQKTIWPSNVHYIQLSSMYGRQPDSRVTVQPRIERARTNLNFHFDGSTIQELVLFKSFLRLRLILCRMIFRGTFDQKERHSFQN